MIRKLLGIAPKLESDGSYSPSKVALTVLFFLAFSLFSCKSSETVEPIIGTWEWSSGSREILPSGFESRHHDRLSTYLVNQEGSLIYEFKKDGTFENTYTHPTQSNSMASGNWTLEGEELSLDILAYQGNGTPITQFKVPFNDDSNLDLQWTAQYLDFSDAQLDEWKNKGFLGSGGWTVNRDSLLQTDGILITSFITIHYEKI